MKFILNFVYLAIIVNPIIAASDHATPFTPEEEDIYFGRTSIESGFIRTSLEEKERRFPQYNWNECRDPYFRGRYIEANCKPERGISRILYVLMARNMERCIDFAASKLNLSVDDFFIVHKGIYADQRHSPRSLHAEGRAIDITNIHVKTFWRGWIDFDFKKHGKGQFFGAFRSCWGDVLYQQNECPLFEGKRLLTGSLGKEDEDHQNHLHLSAPYCVKGTHQGEYFTR